MIYVAGFMFDLTKERVALIRKAKPKWQAGLLNGIGGKVEYDDVGNSAIVREFSEETGYATHLDSWRHFAALTGENWRVDFFATLGDIDLLENKEGNGESIEIVRLDEITPVRRDMIENLPWLISLALDAIEDGRPSFAEVRYPC